MDALDGVEYRGAMVPRGSFFGCVFVVLGCESAPVAPPPEDAFVPYDTQPIPVDRPGTPDSAAADSAASDTAGADTSALDRPDNADRPDRCAPGSFIPCECAAGVLGVRRCLDGGVDPVCRCEGFDGGAGDAVADAGAGDGGAREHLATLCVTCARPGSDCARLSDCYEGLWQPAVVERYAACRVTAGCSGSDDRCAAEALASALPTEESMAFNRACLMLASVCGPDTSVCNAPSTSAVLPAIRAAYQRCLLGPCGLLRDCFRNARPAACNAG